jgi:hypothetical protein
MPPFPHMVSHSNSFTFTFTFTFTFASSLWLYCDFHDCCLSLTKDLKGLMNIFWPSLLNIT